MKGWQFSLHVILYLHVEYVRAREDGFCWQLATFMKSVVSSRCRIVESYAADPNIVV